MVSTLQTLLLSIVSSGIQGVLLEELTITGEFWASCDQVEKLPRTNAAVLHAVLKGENGMVVDTFNELKTAKEAHAAQSQVTPNILVDNLQGLHVDNRNEEAWSDDGAAMALVKTASFEKKWVRR